eukprot:TRINITY_DN59995_c0_g1_i4.p1 TRINITY_DN59995_c0_g1~~TRINITY_DN59995_c0_g1_i4.p1  ORF type:complete len:329 (-),score=24.03 TRINITY_DN59995_c0_g1_i4:6-917(-)
MSTSFPGLRTLRIVLLDTSPQTNPEALRHLIGNHPGVEALDVSNTVGDWARVPTLTAEQFSFICGFVNLKYLRIRAPLAAVPECVGHMVKLQSLNLGPNFRFRSADALPGSLAQLRELREFVAFGVSNLVCPPQDERNRSACRPTSDPRGHWLCPSSSWRVRFDDPALPWWSWSKLALFWVDGNFFEGSIPNYLAEKWPKLWKLDLYDNSLSGPVPSSLGQLRSLRLLQLQNNDFSGHFPLEAIGPSLLEVSMQENPQLRGCLPPASRSPPGSGARTVILHADPGFLDCGSQVQERPAVSEEL